MLRFSRVFYKFSVNSLWNNYIHIGHSHLILDIYTHNIGNIFNKIVYLTKLPFKSNSYNNIVQVAFFYSEILYKLQLVQPILYELQLVQTACTSCNLYRLLVQDALFIYLGFYVAFNTVQVISRWVVRMAEETSTYSLLGFCTVNCQPTPSNYQLSHLRPCRKSNPGLRGGR